MSLIFADRVKEITTTPGTGTLTLGGALAGFRTFLAGIGSGNTCPYAIESAIPGEWEVGVGTVGSGTLARTTVLASSNAGALVNLTAGVKSVFVTLPASYVADLRAADASEAATRAAADSAQVARLDALEAGSGSGGSDGALLVGDGVPDASLGIQGDSYLDRTTGDVYRKWSKPLAWPTPWSATEAEDAALAADVALLTAAWEGTGHPKDLVSGMTMTRQGDCAWATQQGMPVLRFSGAGYMLAPSALIGQSTAWTQVLIFRTVQPSTAALYVENGGPVDVYAEPLYAEENHLASDTWSAATDPDELFAFTPDLDLTTLTVVVSRRDGNTLTIVVNGVPQVLGYAGLQDNVVIDPATTVGVYGVTGSALDFSPLTGDIAFHALWPTQAHSDAVVARLSANPFGVARQAGADLTAEPGIWAKVAELATQAELDAEAGTRGAADTTLAGRATALEAVAPTANQKAALAGTGTPSGTDKYVNNSDARMTDARTPIAHTHPESDVTGLVTDLAAKQALHANLTALAGLVGASDRAFYFTGSGALSLYTLTTFGRSVAALADASALRTLAVLVPGTDVQAYSAKLAALAALTWAADKGLYFTSASVVASYDLTSFGRSWGGLADAAAGRSALSLGALASLATVGTSQIDDAAVTLAKMANMATASLLGRNTAGSGVPEVLSASTVRSLLSLGTAALISSTAGGDLAGTLPSPTVAKITTTTGPTSLTIGAVADGETLKRSGSSVIGYTPSGGVALGSATPLVDATAGAAGSSSAASKDDHVHPAGGLHRHVFVSGWYHFPAGNTATINATLNRQYYIPFPVFQACTVTAIACSVTTLGAAGAVVRLGIYNSDANGLPGTLLIDGGTVASTGTGAKEVTISQALTPGIYWLAVVPQVVTCSLTALVGVNTYGALGSPSNQAGTPIGGYFEAGITGALANRAASDATLGGNFQSNVPRIGLKVTVP